MAMARLMATTGVGVIASSWSYSARIWLQSVASKEHASAWTALIAAWIWSARAGCVEGRHVRSATLFDQRESHDERL